MIASRILRGGYLLSCLLTLAATPATAADEPIVIGQTLPLRTAEDYPVVRTLTSAARAYVEHVNATGGIHGRRIELVTLDHGGDESRIAANVRALVREHKAVALLNCFGEAMCAATAKAAAANRVALVGPLAGTASPPEAARYVIRIRPDYAAEADAMAQQLATLGVGSLALVVEQGRPAELAQAVHAAMARSGIEVKALSLAGTDEASLAALLAELGKQRHGAALVDFDHRSYEPLMALRIGERPEWPPVVVALGGYTTALASRAFHGRTFGYTAVVPNPQEQSVPLVAEFAAHAERYSNADALTFAGLEAYINTRLCLEAIRRAGPRPTPAAVRSTLASLGRYDLGGFVVELAAGRPSASQWVDLGVTSKHGYFLN